MITNDDYRTVIYKKSGSSAVYRMTSSHPVNFKPTKCVARDPSKK